VDSPAWAGRAGVVAGGARATSNTLSCSIRRTIIGAIPAALWWMAWISPAARRSGKADTYSIKETYPWYGAHSTAEILQRRQSGSDPSENGNVLYP